VAGGLALVSTGCSQESAAPRPIAAAPRQAEPESTPVPQPLAVPVADPAPVAPAAPATPPAQEAFSQLVKPGIGVEEWEAAHQKLIDLGAESADVLRWNLSSEDPMAREWAASILALNVDAARTSAEELKQALSDGSGFVRANAAAALALVPGEEDRALEVFFELLQSDDPQLRRMSAMNLSAMPDQIGDHIERLTDALEDTDPEVVQSLVTLLGQIGPAAKPALPKLQQIAARETDPACKSNVEQAVQRIEVEQP
jgi:hypothetical protein